MGQAKSTLKESIINNVALGIDDLVRSYELEIERLTKQIGKLEAQEIDEQPDDTDKIEEIKHPMEQVSSENDILYDLLLSDINEAELREKLNHLEVFYPDEVIPLEFKILSRLLGTNSMACITPVIDDLITRMKVENPLKAEWVELITRFVQEVFDRDPQAEVLEEKLIECYLPALQLCASFFDTPFNHKLKTFLNDNAEVIDSRVLESNETAGITELVHCYFVFDLQQNLYLVIEQIIDEWDFMDANVAEEEFLKLIWFALLVGKDNLLIDRSNESLNYMGTQRAELQLYQYYNDILNGEKVYNKTRLENLMDEVTLFTEYEKVIFLDFLNQKISEVPLDKEPDEIIISHEPQRLVKKQDDIFIEEVSKLPNRIEGPNHPHLQFFEKEVSLAVYNSKTATNIIHYVKVKVYHLQDETEYFIVKNQLNLLKKQEQGNWITVVYKSNSNSFKSRERIQLVVQQPLSQKTSHIVTIPDNDNGSIKQEDIDLNSKSALRDLGYQITGVNRMKRWEILSEQAVPKLGLKRVVDTIAFLVRGRKAMKNGIIRNGYAIAEWENDLERLKRHYYKHDFTWPKTTV